MLHCTSSLLWIWNSLTQQTQKQTQSICILMLPKVHWAHVLLKLIMVIWCRLFTRLALHSLLRIAVTGIALSTCVTMWRFTTRTRRQPRCLTDAQIAANFDVKFELTAFYNGNNSTDESAHAAIASDGYTFRPQPVAADGKQQTYGVDQVRASELGRTPVVRVTLVDKDTKKVYDYGYIRIKITEAAESPVTRWQTHWLYRVPVTHTVANAHIQLGSIRLLGI